MWQDEGMRRKAEILMHPGDGMLPPQTDCVVSVGQTISSQRGWRCAKEGQDLDASWIRHATFTDRLCGQCRANYVISERMKLCEGRLRFAPWRQHASSADRLCGKCRANCVISDRMKVCEERPRSWCNLETAWHLRLDSFFVMFSQLLGFSWWPGEGILQLF